MTSIPEYELTHGIDRSGRPDQVKPGRWWDCLNVRFQRGQITQLPRKVQLARPDYAFRFPATAIAATPAGKNASHTLVFAGSRIYKLLADKTYAELPGENAFRTGDGLARWAVWPHGGRLYCTNQHNPVCAIDGLTITKFADEWTPSARYISVFFDHVFVANITQRGSAIPFRVAWSDLTASQWKPMRNNEADYFDCLERSRLVDEVPGCTGLARMGEELLVYTASTVFSGKYVGLPRVMRFDVRQAGVGTDFYHGLTGNELRHFFVNKRQRNFFSLSPAGVEVIGNDIAKYFFDDLHEDPTAQQATWAFMMESEDEVWWCYVSKNGNVEDGCDKAVVYNYREQHWYPAALENITAFAEPVRVNKTVSKLAGSHSALAGTVDALGGVALQTTRLWGSTNGRLLQDATASDPLASLLDVPAPFLETGDRTYGARDVVREPRSMVIDGSGEIELLVSARDHLGDPVVFKKAPQTWTNGVKEKRLSFPRTAGRVIRYRFEPKYTPVPDYPRRKTVWSACESEVERSHKIEIIATSPITGEIFVPSDGKYLIEMCARGGEGGVTSLKSPWLLPTDPNTLFYLQNYTPKKPWSSKFYGSIGTMVLGIQQGVDFYPVGLQADANTVRALDVTRQQRIYDAIYAQINNYAVVNEVTIQDLLIGVVANFNPANVTQYDFDSWIDMNPTLTTRAGFFQFIIFFSFTVAGAPPPVSSYGAASGGALGFVLELDPGDRIAYEFQPDRARVATEDSLRGATAGSLVFRAYNENGTLLSTFTAAGGGGGGGGGAGVVAANVPEPGFDLIYNVAGENGSASQGGRGLNLISGIRSARVNSPGRGLDFSGGGAGGAGDFVNGLKTVGGAGLLRVSWRSRVVDDRAYAGLTYRIPDDNSAPYPSLAVNGSVTKTVTRSAKAHSKTLTGQSSSTYKVRLRIRGVMDIGATPGGGTRVSEFTYKQSSNTGLWRITLAGVAFSSGVLPGFGYEGWSRKFSDTLETTIFGQAVFRLERPDSGYLVQVRDFPGVAIETLEATDFHEPYFCVVECEPIDPPTLSVRDFAFRGFVDELTDFKAEK